MESRGGLLKMIDRKDAALRAALEALTTQDTFYQDHRGDKTAEAITTIKEAL